MIWAILAILGVPLWFCALAILIFVFRNRSLRRRLGDVPVRVLRPGKQRWTRGTPSGSPTSLPGEGVPLHGTRRSSR